MSRIIVFFCLLIAFTSCDPGHAVYLLNNSSEGKEVQVFERESQRIASVDSVLVADTLSTDFGTAKVVRKAIMSKDVIQKSYSFVLGKGETAVLRQGIGRPKADLSDLFMMVVLGNTDTIVLTNDKRVKVDRQFMSTQVTATVR